MDFDWDSRKAQANLTKHRVSFHEAATVFGDPLAITYPDSDHSVGESRFITFGISTQGRLLVVGHTEYRGMIHIITARTATRAERKIHEEG